MVKKIKTIASQLSKKNHRKRKKGVAKLLAEPLLTTKDRAILIKEADIELIDFENFIPKPCCYCGDELDELLELLKETEKENGKKLFSKA